MIPNELMNVIRAGYGTGRSLQLTHMRLSMPISTDGVVRVGVAKGEDLFISTIDVMSPAMWRVMLERRLTDLVVSVPLGHTGFAPPGPGVGTRRLSFYSPLVLASDQPADELFRFVPLMLGDEDRPEWLHWVEFDVMRVKQL